MARDSHHWTRKKPKWVLQSFHERLKVKTNSRIDTLQFGSLSKTSTTHYLVHLVDTILNGLEKPNFSINLVLVDHQKAFNLFDHNILIRLLLGSFELTLS